MTSIIEPKPGQTSLIAAPLHMPELSSGWRRFTLSSASRDETGEIRAFTLSMLDDAQVALLRDELNHYLDAHRTGKPATP